MTRTTADIQAEITATQAEIATVQARLTDLEIELADLEAELADRVDDLEDVRLSAMASAAHDFMAAADEDTADEADITRKFNETLEVWGGEYADLLSYVFMLRSDYPTAMRYLMTNHPAR